MLLRLIVQLMILSFATIDGNWYIIYILTIAFIMQWVILKPAWSKAKEVHMTELHKIYCQRELRKLILVSDSIFIGITFYEIISFVIYLSN